jgi:hypothetical protein
MSVWRSSGFEELYELGSGAQGRVVLARRAGTGEMEIGPKRNTFFSPENAGAQAEGSLPRITVLP